MTIDRLKREYTSMRDCREFLPPIPEGWNLLEDGRDCEPPSPAGYVVRERGTLLCVIVTATVELDDMAWLHVSMSYKARLPNYKDMCRVKELFVGADKMAYQLFPPKKQHVSFHPFCLHLWHCCDKDNYTPDFRPCEGMI